MTRLYPYNLLRDLYARAFTRYMAPDFNELGRGSLLRPPIQLTRPDRIRIGERVEIGVHSVLLALTADSFIEIGDGTTTTGLTVISAVQGVRLGRKVLLGKNVYIADHNHGRDDPEVPIMDQPLGDIAPVHIGDGAWLGQNVVVLPGVTIGPGAVVGAGSVVRSDVPAHATAVGVPARIVSG